MEDKSVTYIAIIDIRIILEYYTLISILLLVFIWLFNIDTTIYIYNNYRFFLIFISFIERIVGVVITFYKKGNISII